jgi:hypothetical protein
MMLPSSNEFLAASAAISALGYIGMEIVTVDVRLPEGANSAVNR